MSSTGYKKIILSRGRSDKVTTHLLVNGCEVICPTSEVDSYKKYGHKILCDIPDEIVGLGAVRNWINQNIDGDILMLDDDIVSFTLVCYEKSVKIKDSDITTAMLDSIYQVSKDLNASLWGISQSKDPRQYTACEPFSLQSWIGSVIGVNSKELKWDTTNKLRVDVDASLQAILKDRFVWIDKRIGFESAKDFNAGGNTRLRSNARLKAEKEYLKKKWGANIIFGHDKFRDGVNIRCCLRNRHLVGGIK